MKKLIVFGLTVVLLVSSVGFMVSGSFEDLSGVEVRPFIMGSGTPGDPYMIYDVHDLQNMSANLTAHYALANDIDASATIGWNDGAGFHPIGTDWEDSFIGSLHGNNYTIDLLYINRSTTDEVGLFGYIGVEGIVKYLSQTNSDITGKDRVGCIAGTNSGTITQTIATGNLTGESRVGGMMGVNGGTVEYSHAVVSVVGTNYIGGFTGENAWGTVINSSATGDVTGNDIVGGFVGYNSETISGSYATGNVTGEYEAGGFIGRIYEGAISNSYSMGTVTRLNGSIQTSFGGFLGHFQLRGRIENCYSTGSVHYENESDPDDRGFVGRVSMGMQYEMIGNFWDKDTSGQNSSEGEAVGEIEGKTTKEMMNLSNFTEADWDIIDVEGVYFRDTDHAWNIVENQTYPFLSWEENEWIEVWTWHDLYDIRFNVPAKYILMNDLTPETEGYLDYNDPATSGWLPIYSLSSGVFDGRGHEIKGLYINRPNTSNVGLFEYIGVGVVRNLGVVEIDITGHGEVGGIVGRNDHGTVENSYVTGNVSGYAYVGGLVGRNDRTVSNSYFKGNVIGTSFSIGGLVGYNRGNVSSSHATGTVNGDSAVGGFLGWNSDGDVSNSFATGNVSGNSDVGGFVGYNRGTVSNSYAKGMITRLSGTYGTIGGFVGRNYQDVIINCYSIGKIIYENGTDPTDKGFAGSVITGGNYEMSGNFWDVETSGQTSTSGNATGKTTTEMKTQSTFTDAGWDFDDIWHMVEGFTYPLFQWQELPEVGSMVLNLYAYAGSAGWNFVSFNLAQVDTSLTSILADIDGDYDRVMWYDASEDRWLSHVPGRPAHFNNLQTWNHRMGIWIRVTNSTTLTVEGYVPVSTDITLHPGWNMVGLPSETAGNHGLPGEVTRIGYFDATATYNLAYDYEPLDFTFQPGRGYWVYNGADEAVIWTVEY